jgi:hypothetical protein
VPRSLPSPATTYFLRCGHAGLPSARATGIGEPSPRLARPSCSWTSSAALWSFLGPRRSLVAHQLVARRCRGHLRPSWSAPRLPCCGHVWPGRCGSSPAGLSAPSGAAQPHSTPVPPPRHLLHFRPAESAPPCPPPLCLGEWRRRGGE